MRVYQSQIILSAVKNLQEGLLYINRIIPSAAEMFEGGYNVNNNKKNIIISSEEERF